MISTVSATIDDTITFTDIIRALFPMGSMTGAPKISAMKIIDKLETFNRGLYSGSVGYIAPDGNFDLNVVIRSIIYNEQLKAVSIPAGSAITVASPPDKEYDECCLKARALIMSLVK
jgi:para-aminobenzoate synthetase component 1